jgi:type IV pilus assembly protein PilW
VSWYIGNNGRANEGGRSLYRRRLGSGASLITEEVVAGVQNLQLSYRIDGSTAFVAPSAVAAADWATVNAVQLTLTMTSADARVSTAPGTNNGRIERTFTHLVTLRNRVP